MYQFRRRLKGRKIVHKPHSPGFCRWVKRCAIVRRRHVNEPTKFPSNRELAANFRIHFQNHFGISITCNNLMAGKPGINS
jgi:hypothetical protein